MSFLNFKGCKITVVTTATDLRAGYFRLEAFARSTLNIDICSGNHCVVCFYLVHGRWPRLSQLTSRE